MLCRKIRGWSLWFLPKKISIKKIKWPTEYKKNLSDFFNQWILCDFWWANKKFILTGWHVIKADAVSTCREILTKFVRPTRVPNSVKMITQVSIDILKAYLERCFKFILMHHNVPSYSAKKANDYEINIGFIKKKTFDERRKGKFITCCIHFTLIFLIRNYLYNFVAIKMKARWGEMDSERK